MSSCESLVPSRELSENFSYTKQLAKPGVVPLSPPKGATSWRDEDTGGAEGSRTPDLPDAHRDALVPRGKSKWSLVSLTGGAEGSRTPDLLVANQAL